MLDLIIIEVINVLWLTGLTATVFLSLLKKVAPVVAKEEEVVVVAPVILKEIKILDNKMKRII